MEIEGYSFPDDLYYDRNHFWARVEDGLVVMGTTDFSQKLAGEITYVDLDVEGEDVDQGKPFTSLESGKWVGRVYAMVSGEIVEANEELEDEPETVNRDCYGDGWMFKIEPSNPDEELENLMQPGGDFKTFIQSEIARVQDLMKK